MRRFELHRDEDASGVSGVGVVAQGIEFDDGTCALRWLTATSSTAIYASAADIQAIHGHEGRTRLVWQDPPKVQVEFRPPADTRIDLAAVGSLVRRQEILARLNRRL